MKIVTVTCSSKGGAGIAALRLHHALCEAGQTCAFVSKDLTINYEGVTPESTFFSYKSPTLFERFWVKVQTVFGLNSKLQIIRSIQAKKNELDCEVYSVPFSSFALENHPLIASADVIHFHWMGAILNYQSFFAKNKKPLVWTFHDRNPFQGLFHYEADQINNQQAIGSLDNRVKLIKKNAMQLVNKAVMVSPSNWLMKAAMESDFFNENIQFKSLQNGIDLNVFKPRTIEKTRNEYHISEDEFILLYTADSLSIPRKGAHFLIEALENISIPVTLMTIGNGILKIDNPLVTTRNIGYINNAVEMSNCYSIANFFVLPSTEDNLPNTMLESFACGTPVISFPIGGMVQYIEEGFNGVFAEQMDSAHLLKAIQVAYQKKDSFNTEAIRTFAEEKFNFDTLATNYLAVYKTMIDK